MCGIAEGTTCIQGGFHVPTPVPAPDSFLDRPTNPGADGVITGDRETANIHADA